MSGTLKFDEFSALRKRQRAAKNKEEPNDTQDDEPDKTQVGGLFESVELQIVSLACLFVELSGAVLLTIQPLHQDNTLIQGLCKLTEAFLGFSIVYFVTELIALIHAFGVIRFSTHIGNIIDTCVLATQVYAQMNASSPSFRLLSVFRLWRLLRLLNTFLDAKDIQIDSLQATVDETAQKLEEERLHVIRLGDSVKREIDANKRTQKMLKAYKDEVETLNEALKIASLDIATAASEQLQLEEEGEEEGVGQQTAADAPSPRAQKPKRAFVIQADGSFSVEKA